MAACKECGMPVKKAGELCLTCRRDWVTKRVSAVDQAIKELGKPTKETMPALKRRVREILNDKKTS